jgi:hypothetical protein
VSSIRLRRGVSTRNALCTKSESSSGITCHVFAFGKHRKRSNDHVVLETAQSEYYRSDVDEIEQQDERIAARGCGLSDQQQIVEQEQIVRLVGRLLVALVSHEALPCVAVIRWSA